MLCPCGSKNNQEVCCQAIIKGQQQAKTPEQLMRSRYSAYANNNAQYLYDTYANTSKSEQSIAEIAAWAQSCHWVKLIIHHSSDLNDSQSSYPSVKFSAFYIMDKKLYQMTETSRFVKEQQQWRYLDGEMAEHTNFGEVKRNQLCPCLSEKKFKHCCGR